MKLVTIHLRDDDSAPAVFQALKGLVPDGDIHVFVQSQAPAAPRPIEAATPDASAVAEAVRARPGQHARSQALRLVFQGDDTFSITGGDPDHSLRTALGGLTKALRRLYPGEPDPISRFSVRRRVKFPDGRYQGMSYAPTPEGVAVWKRLAQPAQP